MDISVVIPSFQPGGYLLEAIQSVLQQKGNFTVSEVLVVDDGSKDDATLNVYKILSKQPLVKIVKNTGARGSAAARNTGIKLAVSTWILFLDADDILLPNSIDNRAALLFNNPDVVWCGGDFVQFSGNDHTYTDPYFKSRISSYPFLSAAFNSFQQYAVLRNSLLCFLAMAPATTGVIMVKRSALLESGGFDESLKMQQDIHLFLRLALKHDYGFVAVPLLANRQHVRSTTSSTTETYFWRIKAFQKLLHFSEFSPYRRTLRKKIADLYLSNSYSFRLNSDLQKALTCSFHALRYAPLSSDPWKNFGAASLQLIRSRFY